MVIGIVAIAVGDELALAHPHASPTLAATALVFGGPAVFLFAQLAFMHRATDEVSSPRIVGCAALAVLAAATASLSLLVAVIAVAAVLLVVAASDTQGTSTA